jgi:hypothetical protein
MPFTSKSSRLFLACQMPECQAAGFSAIRHDGLLDNFVAGIPNAMK